MSYHYWVSKKEENIFPLYDLKEKGKETQIRRCIYEKTNTRSTNRSITIVENKIVHQMDIYETFNVVKVSDKCRFIYNNLITILEIDGCSMDVAYDIFFALVDKLNDNVMFFIDEDKIIDKL